MVCLPYQEAVFGTLELVFILFLSHYVTLLKIMSLRHLAPVLNYYLLSLLKNARPVKVQARAQRETSVYVGITWELLTLY